MRHRCSRRSAPAPPGPQAEELLSAHGYTLGHFPQSYEYATIGGYAATRSSGQASRGYGRFDDLVHALRIATPVGELSLGVAPASAAGPDLRELFLGSEGAFGVLTEVTVRIRPVPAVTKYGAWTFPDFDSGAAALRELTQLGIRPTVLRLSDKTETRVNAAMGAHFTRMSGCLAVATFEGGSRDQAEIPFDATETVFARHGANSRGEDPARSWERGRFASPALRDTLLDAGVLAETLETATTWRQLPALKAAVTEARDGEPHRRRHEADRAVPHLARLSGGRVALLHRRRGAHERPDRPVGKGEGCRIPRDRSSPAGRSPTITPWVATIFRIWSPRSDGSGSISCEL